MFKVGDIVRSTLTGRLYRITEIHSGGHYANGRLDSVKVGDLYSNIGIKLLKLEPGTQPPEFDTWEEDEYEV